MKNAVLGTRRNRTGRNIALVISIFVAAMQLHAEGRTVKMLPGENWWGCANYFGKEMPFTSATKLTVDLTEDGYANQYASFLLSDRGRAIWCDDLARFEIADGTIVVKPARARSSPPGSWSSPPNAAEAASR